MEETEVGYKNRIFLVAQTFVGKKEGIFQMDQYTYYVILWEGCQSCNGYIFLVTHLQVINDVFVVTTDDWGRR